MNFMEKIATFKKISSLSDEQRQALVEMQEIMDDHAANPIVMKSYDDAAKVGLGTAALGALGGILSQKDNSAKMLQEMSSGLSGNIFGTLKNHSNASEELLQEIKPLAVNVLKNRALAAPLGALLAGGLGYLGKIKYDEYTNPDYPKLDFSGIKYNQ